MSRPAGPRMHRFTRPFFALVLSAFAATPAFSASEYHDLDDAVPGRPGLTFADLLGSTLGRVTARSGGWSIELNDGLRDVEPDSDAEAFPNEIVLSGVEAETLPDGRVALLADSNDFFAVLVVVDPARDHLLVDAVAVTYDRLNALGDTLDLAGGATALRVTSSHLNAGQSYAIDLLIMLVDDRLSLVDAVLTLSDMGCSYRREQTPEFTAIAAPSRAHADIAAAVTETVTATGESCGNPEDAPSPSTRRVAVTYRWDGAAGEYVADSDALYRLQAETEERF